MDKALTAMIIIAKFSRTGSDCLSAFGQHSRTRVWRETKKAALRRLLRKLRGMAAAQLAVSIAQCFAVRVARIGRPVEHAVLERDGLRAAHGRLERHLVAALLE